MPAPLTILIAEDNAADRLLLSTIVSRQGHRALTAANGREAVVLFQQELRQGIRRFGHRSVQPLEGVDALPAVIRAEAKPGDLVVCLGAGDITQWAYALPAQLEALA